MLGTDSLISATPSDPAHEPSQPTHQPPDQAPPQPAAPSARRWTYEWVDRRLKVISVLLPVAFILALELVHYLIESNGPGHGAPRDTYRAVFVAFTVGSIAVFALVMFRFIDRAQRQVVRQNRELAAMNAVSSAVQGEVGVDRILDVVLDSVLTTSGAAEVSVTIFSTEDRSETGARVSHGLAAPGSALPVSEGKGTAAPTIDFPLSTGTATVGRMRLRLPVDAGANDCLASGTLQNIGHQLASAIQRAQLVHDLQRRKHEGHAFYDVLLQISNQDAPPDILSAVVGHARELIGSDEAVLSLAQEASRSVQFAGTHEGAAFADGTACITSAHGARHLPHDSDSACPVRSSPDWKTTMAVTIRGPIEILGDLWIGRRSTVLFTERDRAFLVTLSGLAAIAITSAQMRENGRQRAVVAERGRIAREMHDSLAQVLGVTHLRLRAADEREEVRSSRELAAELAELADICQEAYQDVRESILGLRGSNTTDRGLLENLRAYLAKYSQHCGIKTSLDSQWRCERADAKYLDHELALSPRSEVQVIRVIQEALTNVRKHSGARSAIVRVTESDTSTTFVVEDDGHGWDSGASTFVRDGFGLYTMSERMALLNGTLTVDSAPGRGTRVIAIVPERSNSRPALPR